jgi:hypothetical protein
MSFITKAHQFISDLKSIDHQPLQGEFRRFADAAYTRYIEWFGAPDDAEWDYEIIRASVALCSRDPIRHLYVISIRRDDAELADQYASIAHEMYHRVTERRKGLNRKSWVDEILAYLTSQRFLHEQGMADYADTKAKSLCKQRSQLTLEQFKSVRRKPNLLGILGPYYPPGFAVTAAKLGGELEAVVDWEYLCKLIEYRTFEEWINHLPSHSQRLVRGALNV